MYFVIGFVINFLKDLFLTFICIIAIIMYFTLRNSGECDASKSYEEAKTRMNNYRNSNFKDRY